MMLNSSIVIYIQLDKKKKLRFVFDIPALTVYDFKYV